MAARTGTSGHPWRGDDFPDWFPPMLVRELRQGIQSGAFVWTFLLIQAALWVHATFTVLTAERFDGPLVRAGGGVFWAILALGVGIVLPLRGLSAISAERAGNNLDLVRLTRLSALRIVAGKWAAIVAQILLATAAVLPYLVLRYFLGGIDVLSELRILGWLVVAAAVTAALAVYASTRPLRERIGLLLVAMFGGQIVAAVPPRVSGITSPGDWFWLGATAVYTMLFLEAAAASIAPPSANHAVVKRIVGLACAAVVAGVGLAGSQYLFVSVAVACGLPVLMLAVGALCERPVRFRRLHAVFDRGGLAGRAAAAVFTPGWATGLVFVALAGCLIAVGFIPQFRNEPLFRDASFMAAFLCLAAATIVFPLPLLVALPRLKERGTLYVGLQTVCLVVFAFEAVLRESARSQTDMLPLVMPFPLAGLLRLFGDEGQSVAAALAIAGLVVLAIVGSLIARPWLREMRETQRLVAGGPPA